MSNTGNWWDDARMCDQLAYDARLADYPRGLNRARINALANGAPPYTEKEVQENGITVNVNFLESTALAHSARMQFLQGFVKPGKYFTAHTDYGPVHERQKRSEIVSREINRALKNSVKYYETIRGQFAELVLHGIAPSVWEDKYQLIPRVIGIDDALVPSGTLLGFENLPHVILYRSFTGMELSKLVYGPGKPDPGWNQPMLKALLEWVRKEAATVMNSNWPDVWSPEKLQEGVKESSAYYGFDRVPTVDCYDVYVYVDDEKETGWVRRIIIDAWSTPANTGAGYSMTRNERLGPLKSIGADDFLYNSKKRRVASNLSEIATWQFADLSAVAPFHYHSVRSLGYLTYALCHLQNRTRCSFMEAIFEALCVLMKVKSNNDVQRALKVTIGNRQFIDDSFEFVKPQDRYQAPSELVELGLQELDKLIKSHAGTMTPQLDFRDRTEKTKFQVMAELNVTQALVGAALQQAYQYKKFEYMEIFRRACVRNSKDPKVRDIQARCVRQGVPISMLQSDLWDIEPERIMGMGNKTMELAIAEQLMQWRPLYDPSSQRVILREATSALTDDPARAMLYVPEQPEISNSVHDAQLAAAALMQGLPVAAKSGINETEYIEAMIASMAVLVQKIQQGGGVGTPDLLQGLQNMGNHVAQHIQVIAADKEQAEAVRKFNKQLSVIMNLVKGFQQNLMKQMQAQAGGNGNGGVDPKDIAKIKGEQIKAQAKAANMRESHAQRTAQRQIQFEQKIKQDQQRTAAEIQRDALRTVSEIHANRLRSLNESNGEPNA